MYEALILLIIRLKDSIGWNLVWTSPYIEPTVEGIAVNAKIANPSQEHCNRMVAACYGTLIQLWSIAEDGNSREIGNMTLLKRFHHICLFSKYYLIFIGKMFYKQLATHVFYL